MIKLGDVGHKQCIILFNRIKDNSGNSTFSVRLFESVWPPIA